MVWCTLVGAMTAAGGLLFALDRTPAASLRGVSLPPLLAPGGTPSVEVVFGTRSPLDRVRWESILIHHSGSRAGSPAQLDALARASNLRELGHHFVIGNGNGANDGELYVGRRWLDQLPGAHASGRTGDYLNNHSIGICLIGDGNRARFTEAQMRRLSQLVAALAKELNIPASRIMLHSDVADTTDPGRLFPQATFRESLAAAGVR